MYGERDRGIDVNSGVPNFLPLKSAFIGTTGLILKILSGCNSHFLQIVSVLIKSKWVDAIALWNN